MGTRLKNWLYSPAGKFINFILLMAAAGSMVYVIMMVAIAGGLNIGRDTYYQTGHFRYSYGDVATAAATLEFVYEDIDEVLEIQTDGSINDQIIEVTDFGNSLEEYIRDYGYAREELSKATSFYYAFVNKDTGVVKTNVESDTPMAWLETLPTSMVFDYSGISYPKASLMEDYLISSGVSYGMHNESVITDYLKDAKLADKGEWHYYCGLDTDFHEDDRTFYKAYRDFQAFKPMETLYLTWLSIAFGIMCMTLVMAFFTSGRRNGDRDVHLGFYDRIPLEVQLLLLGLFAVPLSIYGGTSGFGEPDDISEVLFYLIFMMILVLGCYIQLMSTVRLFKAGQFFRNTLVYKASSRICRSVKRIMARLALPKVDNRFKRNMIIWIVVWLWLNLMARGWITNNGTFALGVLLFLATNGLLLFELLRNAIALVKMMDIIHRRREGDREVTIELEKLPRFLRIFGDDLESIEEGLQKSIEDRLKGERMKAELVTNVTHDLKNPLTSIISYVELLKKEPAANENVEKYVTVLDEKSGRLKLLIEQLVDASKASTGNVPVNMGEVDMVQLTRQLCGEYAEKLASRNLNCVVSDVETPLMVHTDGMILYRILDNLMSNIAKYAMEGTRVYVDIKEDRNSVYFALKNISSDPLEKDIHELSGRFVRGDSSRHTEGSGLGLSIAESLAKLIGSELKLSTDGDLFKAELALQCYFDK